MLGKQVWRFMTDLDNVVTKLFKAKYFPKCDFLESKVGHNPSYVWRSIWGAKAVVTEGYKWSIGSGEGINFWDQNWLIDGLSILKPETLSENLSTITVADVLLFGTRIWNAGLIGNLVSSHDTNRILQTPIFETTTSDKRIWKYESDGRYSVRSGYRVSLNRVIGPNMHRVEGEWSLIWNLQVPPKIKHFLWKICRNCLPTRVRLKDRGVNCPQNCVLCDTEDEDSFHIFFDCTNCLNCWHRVGLWSYIQQHLVGNGNSHTIVFNILKSLEQKQQAIFACILWSIWKQRNDVIWRNESTLSIAVCERGLNFLSSWQNAQDSRNRAVVQQQRSDNISWKKPNPGEYKCNVDASFSNSRNRVGIGICLRDDQGCFVLAKTEWISPILKVEEGEALGLLYAIRWVKELQINRVTFELDSKRVVDSFNSVKRDDSEFGAIVGECRNTFSLFFINSRIEFIRRQANEVVHSLAKVATSYASFQLFIDIPNCIHDIIINKMR